MVDRVIVYDSALPQSTDILSTNKFGLQGTGWALQAILGSSVEVAGLQCNPTIPNSLQVTVGPGTIYTLDETDASGYGDLGSDTTVIVKQGILNQPVTLTITPPFTSGYSQVYLVQAILFDQDTGAQVLPYYNAANPSQPFSGPANNGLPNFTIRQTTCAIALKAGLPAPTGSEITPSPDAGYTALWTIDVPNGLAAINSTFIKAVASAPRFPTLPAVPNDVQNNVWSFGVDTGAINAYAAFIDTPDRQPLTTLIPGCGVYIKIAHTNTGVSTFNLNSLGAATIKRANGTDVSAGDLLANMVVALIYDGTNWQMLNFEGASTTGSTVTNTVNIPYAVDTGAANAYVGPFSPAITSLVAGLIVILKIVHNNTGASTMQANATTATTLVDLWGNALTANVLQAGETAIMVYDGTVWRLQYVTTSQAAPTLQVITASGTYFPTAGKTKALVFATGGGASGSCICGGAPGGGAGSTAIKMLSLIGVVSVACIIGAGGAPVGLPGGSNLNLAGLPGGQTSFGGFAVAGGGLGPTPISNNVGHGGMGGTATVGDLLLGGGAGENGMGGTGQSTCGNGGAGFWGGGGLGGIFSQTGLKGGKIGPNYGAGGGGAGDQSPDFSGAGAPGVIMVLEF